MNYKDFQISLIELDLNIKEFAQMLTMNPNSITNYKLKGYVPLQLGILVNLMKEMKKNNLDYLDVITESKRIFSESMIH